jgi:hypothetical protein
MLWLWPGAHRAHAVVRRALLALCALCCLAVAGEAAAEWSADVHYERFRWAESTTPGVTETGQRAGIGGSWIQNKTTGWVAAYHGELYGGSVHYSGAYLFSGAPAEGTTTYSGILNELNGIYRFSDERGFQLVSGLGIDYWTRQLSADQAEDWLVLYARLGAAFGGRTSRGFFAGAGVKYPVYVTEDAHFTDIGFDSNPRLHPRGAASSYAEIGYRFGRHWILSGYYDSYRFKESPKEHTTSGTVNFLVWQPTSSVDTYGLRLHYAF